MLAVIARGYDFLLFTTQYLPTPGRGRAVHLEPGAPMLAPSCRAPGAGGHQQPAVTRETDADGIEIWRLPRPVMNGRFPSSSPTRPPSAAGPVGTRASTLPSSNPHVHPKRLGRAAVLQAPKSPRWYFGPLHRLYDARRRGEALAGKYCEHLACNIIKACVPLLRRSVSGGDVCSWLRTFASPPLACPTPWTRQN